MSYATVSQVQNEFKDITFTAAAATPATPVTTEDVTQWLTDADAEINSRLSTKYRVPITGAVALTMMAMIEIWLVKHRIQDILQVKSGSAKTDQSGTKTYRQMALDMIADLIAGKMILTDATRATPADGVRSYSNDNDVSLVFDRTIDQW